jgi:protein-L-isoaspartate(D-aspartate) O-methyltransferase
MDFVAARHNMVEGQLRTNKVIDGRLVAAMEQLPREEFVAPALRSIAYVDEDIPLGAGRYLIEGMVFARLVQFGALSLGARVLLVGAGCGYGAAVLAHAGSSVVALESDKTWAEQARRNLRAQGIASATVVEGPLDAGWPAGCPYDAVIFEGGIGRLPDDYAAQLVEGGRILAVVVRPGAQGKATMWQKFGTTLTSRVVFDASTPVLPGLELEPGFVF